MPWALKMPLGHLVDLLWRWKSLLVFVGAALLGVSLTIMLGLIGSTSFMIQYMSVKAWFVLAALLAPVGYVLQDVVADAMTVEAVPTVDDSGTPYDARTVKLMHTTTQIGDVVYKMHLFISPQYLRNCRGGEAQLSRGFRQRKPELMNQFHSQMCSQPRYGTPSAS